MSSHLSSRSIIRISLFSPARTMPRAQSFLESAFRRGLLPSTEDSLTQNNSSSQPESVDISGAKQTTLFGTAFLENCVSGGPDSLNPTSSLAPGTTSIMSTETHKGRIMPFLSVNQKSSKLGRRNVFPASGEPVKWHDREREINYTPTIHILISMSDFRRPRAGTGHVLLEAQTKPWWPVKTSRDDSDSLTVSIIQLPSYPMRNGAWSLFLQSEWGRPLRGLSLT